MLAKLMVLHRQILFSLATGAMAEAIMIWTFAEQVPSLHRVSSNFWSSMLVSALMLFELLATTLIFFFADFHSIRSCSVYESVREVLKFTVVAAK